MKTDHVRIGSGGAGTEQALAEVEKYCGSHCLTGKLALHLRLLAEETLGMVRGIAEEVEAEFWLEDAHTGEKEPVCEIHVEARTAMNREKKEALLAVSSSGKNMAAKGIMGRVRDIFSNCLLNCSEAAKMQRNLGIGAVAYESGFAMPQSPISCVWSLNNYREQAYRQRGQDGGAWDELEKSIVARLADEVLVGVQKDRAELIVYKKYSLKARA